MHRETPGQTVFFIFICALHKKKIKKLKLPNFEALEASHGAGSSFTEVNGEIKSN